MKLRVFQVTMTESIDTGTATGRMFLKIIGIFAEFERENLIERTRLGFERKAKEGHNNSTSICSYGYTRKHGSKVQKVVSEEAEIVQRVFNMYLHENYNFSQIAKTLNAENIVSKQGKKWNIVAIRDILINPNYIGKVRYAIKDTARYFENDGQHEAIIDGDIFYQVQEKMKKTKKYHELSIHQAVYIFVGCYTVLYVGQNILLIGTLATGVRKIRDWKKKNNHHVIHLTVVRIIVV